MRETLREALAAAGELLSPRWCAGCGAPDRALCPECAAQFYVPLIEVPLAPFPLWAASRYQGEVREVILAWKRGRADILPALEGAACELLDRWRAEQDCPGPLLFIPAPSGLGRRLRGLLVARGLAEWCARAARGADGLPHRVLDGLRRRRGPGHLAGLNRAARAKTRRRSVRLTAALERAARAGAVVVLVDDVVTTGATLRAAAAALRAAGAQVHAALVLAATPPR